VYREREKEREKERKNREKVKFFLKKNELPPKKLKNILKKCPGTRVQVYGPLVTLYQGSHLNQ
jgi:hypothetical protein